MSKVLFVSENSFAPAKQLLSDCIDGAGIGDHDVFYLPAVEGKKKFGKGDLKLFGDRIYQEVKKRRCKYVMLLGNAPLQAMTGHAGIQAARQTHRARRGYLPPSFQPSVRRV